MQAAPAGDNAVLLDLGEVRADALHATARSVAAMPGVIACIVGHSSLYVIGKTVGDFELPLPEVHELATPPRSRSIRVSFGDAPDLAEFLERTGLALDAFLSQVATLRLTVRYLGFRGGFGYLDGWPEAWSMPRRPTSRPVSRGSFAIAGNVAGFYPIDTPGGWNVLGRTDEELEYALTPGEVITIEPLVEGVPFVVPAAGRPFRRRLAGAPVPAGQRPAARPAGSRHHEGDRYGALHELREWAEVLAAPLATIVHEPDYSLLARGVPAGGAFDEVAAALAKRAVGRCEVLLECAMVGPRLRFREEAVAAWCGPDLSVRVQNLRAGEELSIGRISGGLRGYLAIGRGEGVIAHLQRGDRHVIRAMSGPHDVDLERLDCEVTPQLDRVGIRLRPLIALPVEIPAALRSCGMQFGTIQLHPDGSIVAMGPDHPVTGGYLQPMTVLTSERWKLGQWMPGEKVTFLAGNGHPPN